MRDASFLAAREILSESNLGRTIIARMGSCRSLEPEGEAVFLGGADIEKIVAKWQGALVRQSGALVKYATSNLSSLPGGCLYHHMDDPQWRRAAHMSEIFRNPEICKNAGRLDTFALQANLRHCLDQPGEIVLALGWGQPKRTVGGLKTLGSHADIAELYAIARLAAVGQGLSRIAERPVKIFVLTGGSRFFEALFTRPTLTLAYDAERQRLAEALCGTGMFQFQSYASLVGDGSHTAIVREREDRFAETLGTVDDQAIAGKVSTILLNIDWDHLFAPDPACRHHNPHEIPMPPSVERWLQEKQPSDCNRLIRAAVVGLLSPKQQSNWFESFEDEAVLEDALSFVQAVAWESTRKYIALHAMDADDEASAALTAHGINALRLTVHEKRDHREIPALLTLGAKGGNLLSQHVMAMAMRNGLRFGSYAELHEKDVRPVHLTVPRDGLFGWLSDGAQPLCLVGAGEKDVVGVIAAAGGAA